MSSAHEYAVAGRIAREALELAVNLVEENALLLDLAERVEGLIISRGARPAFPVNISINNVAAHYSPGIDDSSRIPPGALVKVDIGVHVNGYIVDAAVTVPLDKRWTLLAEAAREALRAALTVMKHNTPVNSVAKAVAETIEERGFKPVKNLTGHMVDRYVLHAGKTLPNVPDAEYLRTRVLAGEVYAVEPFATTGRGYVVNQGASHIYRVVSVKKMKEDATASEYLEVLWREFRGLPFSERWLPKLGITLKDLEKLVKARRIHHYPRLVEASGGFVSQFEDTALVLENSCVPLAGVLEIENNPKN
ncbi:MAG: type II methionyl aminopeptidase [Thermofilum sp.]